MKRDFAALGQHHFDLLVCGGGIYGAWTAYDAALRGLNVALIEQADWAGATSSASSKLIHGGLRYLENYDFKLVRKSLRERTMLLQVAPHRVWPLRFGIPVYATHRFNRLQLKLGLTAYDFLASDADPAMHHQYHNPDQFTQHFPFVTTAMLKGGFTYADAQTDDARLVLELVDGAQQAGACCVNYCQLLSLQDNSPELHSIAVQDRISLATQTIYARQIVFTTGQGLADSEPSRDWCQLSKGVHLVMPTAMHDEALLLTAPADGRVFFMIPWYGMTLLGTTDTDFDADTQPIRIESRDIDYLLEAANAYLKHRWTRGDVIGSFAGIRVFKRPAQTPSTVSPSALSRDWELKSATPSVHYAIGGKITSAREDASHIVDTVCQQLGLSTPCATNGRSFPWAPRDNFTSWSMTMSAQAQQLGIDTECTKWALRRHGDRISGLFDRIATDASLAQRIVPSLPFIRAELVHCAATEMVVHLDDLLRRRLPLLILTRLSHDQLQRIALSVTHATGWDSARQLQEVDRCAKLWNIR